jgi:hypothetical protein
MQHLLDDQPPYSTGSPRVRACISIHAAERSRAALHQIRAAARCVLVGQQSCELVVETRSRTGGQSQQSCITVQQSHLEMMVYGRACGVPRLLSCKSMDIKLVVRGIEVEEVEER